MAEGHTTKTLTVAPDRPPCIATTMPDFRVGSFYQKSGEPLRFELDAIDDDGDPFPPTTAQAEIIWEWRYEGDKDWSRQILSYGALDFPTSDLMAHATHSLQVRLTYVDRVKNRDMSKCTETSCELTPPST